MNRPSFLVLIGAACALVFSSCASSYSSYPMHASDPGPRATAFRTTNPVYHAQPVHAGAETQASIPAATYTLETTHSPVNSFVPAAPPAPAQNTTGACSSPGGG